jgi:hypothetical protein
VAQFGFFQLLQPLLATTQLHLIKAVPWLR